MWCILIVALTWWLLGKFGIFINTEYSISAIDHIYIYIYVCVCVCVCVCSITDKLVTTYIYIYIYIYIYYKEILCDHPAFIKNSGFYFSIFLQTFLYILYLQLKSSNFDSFTNICFVKLWSQTKSSEFNKTYFFIINPPEDLLKLTKFSIKLNVRTCSKCSLKHRLML